MLNAMKFPCKEILDGFFAQLLELNNQLRKAAAEQSKVNTLLDKMLPFLGLKNTDITEKYLPN